MVVRIMFVLRNSSSHAAYINRPHSLSAHMNADADNTFISICSLYIFIYSTYKCLIFRQQFFESPFDKDGL
jgi:hypothetical protein